MAWNGLRHESMLAWNGVWIMVFIVVRSSSWLVGSSVLGTWQLITSHQTMNSICFTSSSLLPSLLVTATFFSLLFFTCDQCLLLLTLLLMINTFSLLLTCKPVRCCLYLLHLHTCILSSQKLYLLCTTYSFYFQLKVF
jgi:hypothetical protein